MLGFLKKLFGSNKPQIRGIILVLTDEESEGTAFVKDYVLKSPSASKLELVVFGDAKDYGEGARDVMFLPEAKNLKGRLVVIDSLGKAFSKFPRREKVAKIILDIAKRNQVILVAKPEDYDSVLEILDRSVEAVYKPNLRSGKVKVEYSGISGEFRLEDLAGVDIFRLEITS
ncbi:hypothetical protein [Pyrococcus kukulkanii]|uniref:KaiC-like domain-containing protein n=1 Tax=Pyrococcus kukulkanii TaxID=1609559 RepID=A0ABV4T6E2_9EURY